MLLPVEDTLEVESVPTNHGTVHALVNIGSQDCTGIGLTTIHELSKCLKVICRTNLVHIPDFLERIRRHAEDHHYGHHTHVK